MQTSLGERLFFQGLLVADRKKDFFAPICFALQMRQDLPKKLRPAWVYALGLRAWCQCSSGAGDFNRGRDKEGVMTHTHMIMTLARQLFSFFFFLPLFITASRHLFLFPMPPSPLG
ncbi:hypothetical protein, unlikely [Trypanosoma brucei gambiense DAL972]|uniref:Uncharacterized protein n=1 Tax=Trypanosoma brucei gambiense (strain MHOM/CI/86/DAL972) TaxID=679716 RepID=C9ZTH7_TRYB9|nr:hypothetical protein, unlikely [Trypanosoma brucei gambiense DAL972]CBH12712.1 hypothetical protein, unlikely [Trypanosoma brucei gambiense DAL972]|eukprot:XP_011774992.1 hypothetical protein, unlikely [Trypanosoma brucei gambiense DAL972]